MDLFDIHKIRTSPYHPQADGLSERMVQTSKNMITAFINEHQDNWDEHLEELSYAFNTAVHSTTGFTPFELMFHRKQKLPLDVFYEA